MKKACLGVGAEAGHKNRFENIVRILYHNRRRRVSPTTGEGAADIALDYEQELRAFYDWLEINSLPDSAIALWHALMHINSRAGWVEEITVAVSTLSTKAGLKKDAIGRARNRLQQVGRIEFRSRSGQQSAVYKIIPFAALKTTQTASQSSGQSDCDVLSDANRVTNRAQTASQTEHKPRPLKDLDLKDLDLSSLNHSATATTATPAPDHESFAAAYKRVYQRDLTQFQAQQVGMYIDNDGMEEAVIVRAIEKSALKEGGLQLVLKILDDYLAAGAKTLAGAVAIDDQFTASKQRPARRVAGQAFEPGKTTKTGKPTMSVVNGGASAPTLSDEDRKRMREEVLKGLRD